MSRRNIHLNGITYRWPVQPVVVVCIDGGDPAYIEQGIRDGIIPNIARFTREGQDVLIDVPITIDEAVLAESLKIDAVSGVRGHLLGRVFHLLHGHEIEPGDDLGEEGEILLPAFLGTEVRDVPGGDDQAVVLRDRTDPARPALRGRSISGFIGATRGTGT